MIQTWMNVVLATVINCVTTLQATTVVHVSLASHSTTTNETALVKLFTLYIDIVTHCVHACSIVYMHAAGWSDKLSGHYSNCYLLQC